MGETQAGRDDPIPQGLTPFLAPLQAFQELLSIAGSRGVIVGGIAASLSGIPRYTVDVDAVILLSVDDLPKLVEQASAVGLNHRISDPISFATRTRVLLLRHTDSKIDVDVSLGALPFEFEMVDRSRVVEVGHLALRIPTPEDLIIMKAVAQRPKDLEDIRAIAEINPDLDHARIRFWVEQFGEILEQPDLWVRILSIL